MKTVNSHALPVANCITLIPLRYFNHSMGKLFVQRDTGCQSLSLNSVDELHRLHRPVYSVSEGWRWLSHVGYTTQVSLPSTLGILIPCKLDNLIRD